MTQYTVNIDDIENSLIALGGTGTTRAIQDHVLQTFCQGVVPSNYQTERTFRQTIQRKMEDYCPQAEGFDATRKEPKFIRTGHGIYKRADNGYRTDFPAVGEVKRSANLQEGSITVISVNSYERNPVARKLCIQHHGCICTCCGFDFEKVYGVVGRGFIHVHHIKPLAEIGSNYTVDPANDLVPLCANCHAIIHRVSPALLVHELIPMLKEARVSEGLQPKAPNDAASNECRT